MEISWRHRLCLHICRGNKSVLSTHTRRKITQIFSRESPFREYCLKMGTGFCLHNSQTETKRCHMFCWVLLSLPPFIRKLKPISLLVPWNLSESWLQVSEKLLRGNNRQGYTLHCYVTAPWVPDKSISCGLAARSAPKTLGLHCSLHVKSWFSAHRHRLQGPSF